MSAYGKGKILKDYILTAHQGKPLIAEPCTPVSPAASAQGVFGIAALQDIFLNPCLFPKMTAGDQPFAADHDIFQVRAVEQAVGKVGGGSLSYHIRQAKRNRQI